MIKQTSQVLAFIALTALFWYLHPALAAIYIGGLVVHVIYRWRNKSAASRSTTAPTEPKV